MRHEAYMRELEQAGKEAYGNLDMVNSPPHYNKAGVECIDAIQAATEDPNTLAITERIKPGIQTFLHLVMPSPSIHKDSRNSLSCQSFWH